MWTEVNNFLIEINEFSIRNHIDSPLRLHFTNKLLKKKSFLETQRFSFLRVGRTVGGVLFIDVHRMVYPKM